MKRSTLTVTKVQALVMTASKIQPEIGLHAEPCLPPHIQQTPRLHVEAD